MSLRLFIGHEKGAAASEFVLSLPMILILIFVSMEAGNFFWSQQKLTQAVRDGARYAARLDYTQVCPATGSFDTAAVKNVVKTGSPTGNGQTRLPLWNDAKVRVTPHCDAFVNTGIYKGLGTKGAFITVAAVGMPYRPILGTLGFIDSTFALAAKENAAVVGI